MIAPVTDMNKIPKDAECQEASVNSGNRYIPCGQPAVSIVASDARAYWMCLGCTMHNLRNRGAALIYTTDAGLKQQMKEGKVRTATGPDLRENQQAAANQTSEPGRMSER